jgi:hypothetical protein
MELGAIQSKSTNTYRSTVGKSETVELKDKIDEKRNKNKSETTGSIKAGELNLQDGNGWTIKELFAQRAALKIQLDQYENDTRLDGVIQEHIDMKASLREGSDADQSQVNRLESLKGDLKKTYGVEDGSTEQKDYLILEKQALEKELTDEEQNRLVNMGPMTDYQNAAMEYTKMEKEFIKRINKATNDYFNENRSITAIKLGRLKDSPMVDAKKEAEDLLKKVDGEIQKSLVEELKNRVNDNLDIDPNASILDNPKTLIDQKKATEEDLKGLAVDEKV